MLDIGLDQHEIPTTGEFGERLEMQGQPDPEDKGKIRIRAGSVFAEGKTLVVGISGGPACKNPGRADQRIRLAHGNVDPLRCSHEMIKLCACVGAGIAAIKRAAAKGDIEGPGLMYAK